jgi:hypothetical protein
MDSSALLVKKISARPFLGLGWARAGSAATLPPFPQSLPLPASQPALSLPDSEGHFTNETECPCPLHSKSSLINRNGRHRPSLFRTRTWRPMGPRKLSWMKILLGFLHDILDLLALSIGHKLCVNFYVSRVTLRLHLDVACPYCFWSSLFNVDDESLHTLDK